MILPIASPFFHRLARLAFVPLVCGLYLACTSANAQSIVPPAPENADSMHGLNFQQTPLENVLELYGEITGKSIMLNPSVAQVNITFVAREPLSATDALIAIETMLGMNNVSILPFLDNFIRVQPVSALLNEEITIQGLEGSPAGGPTIGGAAGTGDGPSSSARMSTAEPIVKVIPLKHMSFDEAQVIIQPLLHTYSKIQYIERTNSMLIYDTAANVQRILDLLNYADKPQDFVEETFIVQVVYAVASEIKATIDELVTQAQEDQQQPSRSTGGSVRTTSGIQIRRTTPGAANIPTGPSTDIARLAEKGLVQGRVKVTADDRTNQLIILTRKENYDGFIRAIIERLDVAVDPEIGYRIMRLEYADAEEIAGTLNDLIGNVTGDSGGAGGNANTRSGTTGGGQSLSDILRNRGGNTTNNRTTGGTNNRTNVRPQSSANPALRERAAEALNGANLGQLGENTRIIADTRTNSILITGRPEDIDMLDSIVGGLDMMLPQVLIEVAILEVGLNDNIDYGLDWLQRSLSLVNRETLGPAGGVNVDDPVISFGGGSRVGGSGTGFLDGSGVGRDIDLSAGGLTYFATFYDFNLDAILSLAAGSSEARVLSIPQILTTDNTDAAVVIGESRPIPTASSTTVGGVIRNTFEYRDIGINLELTPHINPNNVVVLEISASADNVGGSVTIDGNEVPIITRRDLSGEIAIKDGATVALGGLVSEDERNTETKVPFLGDIPIAGNLFKSVRKDNIRTELLVLITPKVLLSQEEAQEATDRLHGSTESVNARWDRGWSVSKYAEEPVVQQTMWRDRMHDMFPHRDGVGDQNPNFDDRNRSGRDDVSQMDPRDMSDMRERLGPERIAPDVRTGRSPTVMFPNGRGGREMQGGLVGGSGFRPQDASTSSGATNLGNTRRGSGLSAEVLAPGAPAGFRAPVYQGTQGYQGSQIQRSIQSAPALPPGPPLAKTFPMPSGTSVIRNSQPTIIRSPAPSVPAGPPIARTYPGLSQGASSGIRSSTPVIRSNTPVIRSNPSVIRSSTPSYPSAPVARTYPVESTSSVIRSAPSSFSAPVTQTMPVAPTILNQTPAIRRTLPTTIVPPSSSYPSTIPANIPRTSTGGNINDLDSLREKLRQSTARPNDVQSIPPPRYLNGGVVTDPAVRDLKLPSPIPMR